MSIYRMLGVNRREPLIADYYDVKQLNDTVTQWRARIRSLIADYRRLQAATASDRHLIQRHILLAELEMTQGHINLAWGLYRAIQHDAALIKAEFLKEISHKGKTGRRRSA